MSDRLYSRERKARALPPGYQFGDGRCRHDYRAKGWFVRELDAHFYTAVCQFCGHDGGPIQWHDAVAVYGVSTSPFLTGRDCGDEA